jgi:3-oxoacyl-[acyl-carrier protein] reductase
MKDRVAVITGASRGIGRAIALRFARDGARVVLSHRHDVDALRSVEETCRALGAEVATITGDVASEDTVLAIRKAAMDRFGRIDVLVNSAGAVCDGLVLTLEDADLERMVATNVLGVVRMTRGLLRSMLEQRSGCIINLSSVLATRGGRGNAVYSGTKGFVESFTRAVAAEVGRKGIRVNAIAPGVVTTDMSSGVRALATEELLESTPLRRFGSPDDVAAVAAFLASDEAAFITGAVLPVDGGIGSL